MAACAMNNNVMAVRCCRRISEAHNLSEIKVKVRNIIRRYFPENNELVQRIEVDCSCAPHSSTFGIENCEIRSINGMKSFSWHPVAVDRFLDHLIRGTKDFILVIVFCEDDPSNNNDHVLWDLCFMWCKTGFVCVAKLSESDYVFKKDLVLIATPTQTCQYLITMNEKLKGKCVVMDEDRIQFETQHTNNFVQVFEYYGWENDQNSRHNDKDKKQKKDIFVFGFKLTSINSDTTKCLGAVDSSSVALVNSNIPPHPNSVVQTKSDQPDHRFFYHIISQNGHSMFESTQFENHYLAVKDSDGESPSLGLKKCMKEQEYDPDILFTWLEHREMERQIEKARSKSRKQFEEGFRFQAGLPLDIVNEYQGIIKKKECSA